MNEKETKRTKTNIEIFTQDNIEFFEYLEDLPICLFIADKAGVIQYANMALKELSGYENLIGYKQSALLKDFETHEDESFGEPHTTECILYKKNREQLELVCNSQPIIIANRKYKLITISYNYYPDFKIQNEIPDEKTDTLKRIIRRRIFSEQVAIEDIKKLEILFDNINDSLFLCGLTGNIIKVNNQACERLGYNNQELTRMNIRNIDFKIDKQRFEDLVNKLKNKEVISFETEHITKDGIRIPTEITSKIIKLEGKDAVLSSARNISLRKKYENELIAAKQKAEENEAQLEAIFNNVPSTIILLDKNEKIRRINHQGIKDFNAEERNVKNAEIGNVINCIYVNGNRKCRTSDICNNCLLIQVLEDTIRNNAIYHQKELDMIILVEGNKQNKTFLFSSALIKQKGEELFLITLDDISERKKMEHELIEAKDKALESERLKTSFLNNLSFELRTPLSGIMGFSELLLKTDSQNDIRNFANIINKSGKKLLNVIEDLFIVSSLISGNTKVNSEKIELISFIEDAKLMLYEELTLMENQNNIKLRFNFPETTKKQIIYSDPVVIKLVIKNLARNAYKFTEKGFVEFGIIPDNIKKNIFYIKDTGIGIEPDKQSYIFNYFRQGNENIIKKYGGIGTGLSITKSLVELISGEIWVISEPEEGSTFYFTVAASVSDNEIKDRDEKTGNEKAINKTILVVENDDHNDDLINTFLKQIGIEVKHVSSGADAIRLIESGLIPHIILMDLQLPGTDVFETIKSIKQKHPDIYIIALSEKSASEDIKKAINYGYDDFLTKPIRNEIFAKKIHKYL